MASFGVQPTYHAGSKAESTEYDRERDRIKQGQCITCGIQTHKSSSRLKKSLVPLTNDDVRSGRCLLCKPLPPGADAPGEYEYDAPPIMDSEVGAFNPDVVIPPPVSNRDSRRPHRRATRRDSPPPEIPDTPLPNEGEVLDDEPPEPGTNPVLPDTWLKRHQRWVIGGSLLIFGAVAVILGVTLSSKSSPPTTSASIPATPIPTLKPTTAIPTLQPASILQVLQASAMELVPNEEILLDSNQDWDSNKNVAVYGDTAVVGAPFNDNKRGSAFVFVRDENGEWALQYKLVDPDGAAGDYFGYSVGIFGDTVIVGAPDDDDNGSRAGSAHIFARNRLAWTHQAKLLAPDGAVDDRFGLSVGIYDDTAIVGVYGDDDNGGDIGSAHIFARNGVTWSHQAKLLAPNGAVGDSFGRSVAIYGDTAIVGAYGDDDKGDDSGSAYIFVRNGITWTHQAKLLAPDGAVDDRFGRNVGIYDDTVIVGAHEDDDNGDDSGSVHLFARNGVAWSHQAKLLAPDGAAGDQFGISIGIYGDTVIVGARYDDDDNGDDNGSAHLFVGNGVTWSHQAKLAAPKSGLIRFGQSVDIYNGTSISGSGSGEVYVFSC